MKHLPKKSLKRATVVNAKDFDRIALEFANNERSILRLESKMNTEIDAIKAKYADRLEPAYASRLDLVMGITAFAKSVWNGTTIHQLFNYVKVTWTQPKGSLVLEDEEATIATLKTLGAVDLVRVTESLKKDEFKARFAHEPELMLSAFGAKIEKPAPTVKEVEVLWASVEATVAA
jgi:phage host-nuclease inhibitor protein Gam